MGKIFEKSTSDATIKEAIRNKENFVVSYPFFNFLQGSRRVERLIEECGMTCQVYTRGRVVAAIVGGGVTTTGLAVHNAISSKFDFEVARNLVTGNITVTYVR